MNDTVAGELVEYDLKPAPDGHIMLVQYHYAMLRLYGIQTKFAAVGKYQEVRGEGGRFLHVQGKRFWVPLAYAQMEVVP